MGIVHSFLLTLRFARRHVLCGNGKLLSFSPYFHCCAGETCPNLLPEPLSKCFSIRIYLRCFLVEGPGVVKHQFYVGYEVVHRSVRPLLCPRKSLSDAANVNGGADHTVVPWKHLPVGKLLEWSS